MKKPELPKRTRRRATRERIRYSAKRRAIWLATTQVEKRFAQHERDQGWPAHDKKDHYWPDGRPMSFKWWIRMFEDPRSSRIVEFTRVKGALVSTVWLGLDHGHSRTPVPPLIFETIVFRPHGPSIRDLRGTQWQYYATEAEARAGHWRTVELVTAVVPA